MSWAGLFQSANLLALVAWALLVFGPRGALSGALVLYGGVGLLCLTYAVGLLVLLGGGGADAGGGAAVDFTTVAGVRAIFASDAGVAIGWTHYLAFDLFAGLWIARDADDKRFSRLLQAPILLLTFIAGPAGLFIWLLVRERAARAAARIGNRR